MIVAQWIWFALALSSAAVKLSVEIDRREIGLDESVTLKLKLTANENVALPEPTAVAPDFDVVNSYPQTFLRNLWVSGQITTETQMTVTKILRPRRQGSLEIRQIQAQVRGVVVTAPSISVRVVGVGRGTPPPALGREEGVRKGFMVKAEVNKSRVYHGEQIILSYYLFRRSQLVRPEIRKFPDLADFNKQELEVPVQNTSGLEWEDVVVAGEQWSRALLFRYAAYPIRKGEARVDSAQVDVQVPIRSQFDDLLQDSFLQLLPLPGLATRSVHASSPLLKIEVMPLPDMGRPSDFTGIIGEIDVVSAVDKTELKVNEALTVTLKLEGRANFSGLTKPMLTVPDGLESFEVRDRTKMGIGGIGEKVFEYVLVPRREGNFRIPGISVSYFDPSKKQYRVAKTDPMDIQVQPGGSAISNSFPAVESTPSMTQTGLKVSVRSVVLGIAVFLGLALTIGLFLRRMSQPKIKPAAAGRRPSNSKKSDGYKEWQAANQKSDLGGMETAVHQEIGNRLNLGDASVVRGMPRRELEEEWLKRGGDQKNWQILSNLLDSLEMARFSGVGDPGGADSPLRIQLAQLAKQFFSSTL